MKAEIKRNFVYISRRSKCLHIPIGWIHKLSYFYLSQHLHFPPSLAYPPLTTLALHQHFLTFTCLSCLTFTLPILLFLSPSPFSFFSLSPSPYSFLPLLFLCFPSLPRLIPFSLSFFFVFPLYLPLFVFSFFTPSPERDCQWNYQVAFI